MSVVYIIAGLVLLVIGGELLVRSSVGLSFKLKLSKLVIGMTVVSFATSAPELFVSVGAAWNGHTDLALGNVIGSNIANLALVLGLTVLISPLFVDKEFFFVNWPMMLFSSILLYFFLQNDLVLSRIEGGILLVLLIAFVVLLISRAKKLHISAPEDIDESLKQISNSKIFIWFVVGMFALYFGSDWLIKGASEIALKLGVTEAVIAATMVAFGTSVPELAASIIAALKQEKALSLGNLIGSNIFNIGSVLGITALIQPVKLNSIALLNNDMFWMIGIAFIILPMAFLPIRNKLSRIEGLMLLIGYVIFVYLKFVS